LSNLLIANIFFRTLQEHPTLLQLYRDLVITQVISSEEFWSQHAAEYTQAKKIQRQEIGVNSAFLVGYFSLLRFCLKYKLLELQITLIDSIV